VGRRASLQENLAQNTRFLTGNPRFSGISKHFVRDNLGYLAPEPGSCGSTRDFWSPQGTGAALLQSECPSARAPRPLRSLWRPRAPCPAPPRPEAAAPRPDSGLGGGGGAARGPPPLGAPARAPAPGPPPPGGAAPPPQGGGGGGGGRALSDRSLGARCPRPTTPLPRAPTCNGREDGAGRDKQQCTGRLS